MTEATYVVNEDITDRAEAAASATQRFGRDALASWPFHQRPETQVTHR